MYIENPKTKGSGLICAIPQQGKCPQKCKDCFYQSGRGYLEPLDENTPNMPTVEMAKNRIVRVNDGNDSNYLRKSVVFKTKQFQNKFYNTSLPVRLGEFDAPVVLTINPGMMTDCKCYQLQKIPPNLMFVRFRTNTWNLNILDLAVKHYTKRKVPVVLTFMAYHKEESIPEKERVYYRYRKRTTNSYWAITTSAWDKIMSRYKYNYYLYSCGIVEGELGTSACSRCGNCIREYFNTKERMR